MSNKITNLVARCCDGTATVPELEDLYEHDCEVTFATFFRHVSLKVVCDVLGYRFGRRGQGLNIRNDYAIRFYRSKFRGQKCWHIDWSAIVQTVQMHRELVGVRSIRRRPVRRGEVRCWGWCVGGAERLLPSQAQVHGQDRHPVKTLSYKGAVMSDEKLENIPHDQTDNFPQGVCEESFDTEAEMSAFLQGFNYADDVDAYNAQPFKRDGKVVVRVCVGDWDDEDGEFEETDEDAPNAAPVGEQ